MFTHWFGLTTSMTMLALESQEVIALRLAKLAKGDRAARREAHLMVHEKWTALGEAMVKAASGGSSKAVVAHYRKKVKANRIRLAH